MLGGRGVFPSRIKTTDDLRAALRQGFPYGAFEAVLVALEFSATDLAQIMGVASRTLARRKTNRQLSPIESDRLYRIARITLQASRTFGSLDKGRSWLHHPNPALGGESPILLLDTEIGERQVEDVLTRIDHGIYS